MADTWKFVAPSRPDINRTSVAPLFDSGHGSLCCHFLTTCSTRSCCHQCKASPLSWDIWKPTAPSLPDVNRTTVRCVSGKWSWKSMLPLSDHMQGQVLLQCQCKAGSTSCSAGGWCKIGVCRRVRLVNATGCRVGEEGYSILFYTGGSRNG